jgi:C-terminal processing protease CtpA/Prc
MARMSGVGVFRSDESPTQRIGIVPDIESKPTIAGLRAGRDEVLEVAIREIVGEDMSESDIRKLAAYPR